MSPKAARDPGPIGREVVAIIRERLGRQRLTLADLIRITGLPQSTLSRTLAEKREIGIDEVEKIGRVLGTSAAELISEAAVNVQQRASSVTTG